MGRNRKSNKLYASVIMTALVALVAVGYNSEFYHKIPNITDSGFEVHYIDVGQADSELVICGDKSMLIDGGNAEDSNLIVSYLRDMNIDHLDYVICTHAHEDHVGGLSGALHECVVDNVLCSTDYYDTKVFKNFKKFTEEQGKNIEIPNPGDSFTLGESYVEFLGPQKDYDDLNNNSIVMKVTYGDTSFLFTGDAEREAEKDIIDAGYDLSADVLKVGHHGSSSSTSYVFLREVMPEYAVISCGKDNSYGHPHKETMSRLKDAGVKTYRTDESGHIVAASNGTEITFSTEK